MIAKGGIVGVSLLWPCNTSKWPGVHNSVMWPSEQGRRSVAKTGGVQISGAHGERGARAYIGGLWVEPPAGSRGRAPGQGGKAP